MKRTEDLARRSPKGDGGFTLLELTIALAVVVIASGFVIVRLTAFSSRDRLQASARTLGSVITTWRERARALEVTYVLELEEDRYQVSSGKELLRKGRLGSGERLEGSGARRIVFTPRGVLSETRITLSNASGDRLTLTPIPLTSDVEITDAPR